MRCSTTPLLARTRSIHTHALVWNRDSHQSNFVHTRARKTQDPGRPPEDPQPTRGHYPCAPMQTHDPPEGNLARTAKPTHRTRIRLPLRIGTRGLLESNSVPAEGARPRRGDPRPTRGWHCPHGGSTARLHVSCATDCPSAFRRPGDFRAFHLAQLAHVPTRF